VEVVKPIFIVGAGRSGSTVVHTLLARHPQLAWLSGVTRRFPNKLSYHRRFLGALDLPVVGPRLQARFSPWECFDFWERFCPGFRRSCRDLGADDATPVTRKIMRRVLGEMLTPQRARLVLKASGWGRIGYLKAIFPDAKLLHVLRDGRGVANSLLRVNWWLGWQGPQNWRYGDLPAHYEAEWVAHQRSFVALAGIQWKVIMDSIDAGRQLVDPSDFHELRYEDLCDDPIGVMKKAAAFAEIDWSQGFEDMVRREPINSMNRKWQEELNENQQRILQTVLTDALAKHGYA
jgi:hypothetical protein